MRERSTVHSTGPCIREVLLGYTVVCVSVRCCHPGLRPLKCFSVYSYSMQITLAELNKQSAMPTVYWPLRDMTFS